MYFSSYPHWFTRKRSESTIKSLWSADLFKLLLVVFGSEFERLGILLIQWFHRELLLIIFEKSPKFKIILGVQVRFYCDIILNELQELLLELVNFFGNEEWVDEREIGVGEVAVIPHFLGYE